MAILSIDGPLQVFDSLAYSSSRLSTSRVGPLSTTSRFHLVFRAWRCLFDFGCCFQLLSSLKSALMVQFFKGKEIIVRVL